ILRVGRHEARRLSRTEIRNQKREGPTSTAARPPQRVGSAGRFAGPDRIPARCAAFAPAPRPRSGVRGFADTCRTRKPGAKTMEQTVELRIVDPKTLNYSDKRDPRQVPADRLSDAALKANSNAIGFV